MRGAVQVPQNRAPQSYILHQIADARDDGDLPNPVPVLHQDEESMQIVANGVLGGEADSQAGQGRGGQDRCGVHSDLGQNHHERHGPDDEGDALL